MPERFVLITKSNFNKIVKTMGWNNIKSFTIKTGIVAKDMIGNFFEVIGGGGLGKAVSAQAAKVSKKGIFQIIHDRGYKEDFNTYMKTYYRVVGSKYYEK